MYFLFTIQVEKEKQKLKKMLNEKLAVKTEPILSIPQQGLAHTEILKKMEELRDVDEHKWKTGKLSGKIH